MNRNVRARRRFALLLGLLAAILTAGRSVGETLRIPEATTGSEAHTQRVILRGDWGSAPGQFGKVDEASRPGPMDFTVRGGTLYVLDPVNARVQLFGLDGRFRREIPIGTRTADFMCVDGAGSITVLDAFVRREFKTFSAAGELLAYGAVPASISLPSAIFAAGERVWIEERHDRVHELCVERSPGRVQFEIEKTVSGRPMVDDCGALHVRKTGTHEVRLRLGTSEGDADVHTLRFPRAVSSVVALEADDSGRVYIAARCLCAAARDQWKADIVLVVMTPKGAIVGTLCMPDAYVTDHYRKLCVSPDGDVIQMQTTEDDVRFVHWALRAGGGEGRTP